ncbi:hypothetical protein L1275_000353 [Flavobacterium sp. HSC-61S13]|nr:hypothetical protein [Flavobacterium sp. HSC-61S13]
MGRLLTRNKKYINLDFILTFFNPSQQQTDLTKTNFLSFSNCFNIFTFDDYNEHLIKEGDFRT